MKENKTWPRKECKICKKMFQPFNNSQNYCKNPCKCKPRLTIREMNEAWALRTQEDKKKQYKNSKENFIYNSFRLF